MSRLDSVTGFLGDALEFIRNSIKKVFKVAFKVVFKGIKLILTIAGKIISFVVKTVGPLIQAVGSFLKDTLGIDFGALFKMLGLVFDPAKTKLNQKVRYRPPTKIKSFIAVAILTPNRSLKATSRSSWDYRASSFVRTLGI
jgi:hypothetical protein